ncbi:VOC family protein [Nonomuraea sp. NPDC046570]|uniref:VOC family protein n=1 Tax=Nonomuraea sp. NPDC046570 TaxID=3155255 RepID=UPI0034111413
MSTSSASAQRTLTEHTVPIPPIRLAHVVFRTNQLTRMTEWYSTVLAARTVFANENLAFLTYDEEHHRIALIGSEEYAPRPGEVTVGFYHAAFTFDDLGALLSTYRRLHLEGIDPFRTIHHGPTVSMYYRDPDGNDIEFQVDVFPDADQATDWMAGEVFTRNPVGTLFDPEELVARYLDGTPLHELVRRSDDPPATG